MTEKSSLLFSLLLCTIGAVGGAPSAPAQEPDGVTVRENAADAPSTNPLHACRPGPWGDLNYYYVHLEAPDEFVRQSVIPSEVTVWRFVGMSSDAVTAFLHSLALPAQILSAIQDQSQWYVSETETRILPHPVVIVNLSPEARTRIYSLVRPWRDNEIFFKPIAIEYESAEQWFEGLDLPPTIPPLVHRLTYPQGKGYAFSDIPFVLSQLESEHQRRTFIRALTRTRSIVLRLTVDGSTDLRSVADYWSSGSRFKDTLPLLESVAKVPEVNTLDVTHLLPPLPRKRLFTFPSPGTGFSGRFPDGLWTAFNFFQFSPIQDLPDEPEAVETYLKSRYIPAGEDPRFGDLIVLRHPMTKSAMHAAVRIADDIVYTKNGASIFRPWTMMKMDSMLLQWSHRGRPEIEYWRLKE